MEPLTYYELFRSNADKDYYRLIYFVVYERKPKGWLVLRCYRIHTLLGTQEVIISYPELTHDNTYGSTLYKARRRQQDKAYLVSPFGGSHSRCVLKKVPEMRFIDDVLAEEEHE